MAEGVADSQLSRYEMPRLMLWRAPPDFQTSSRSDACAAGLPTTRAHLIRIHASKNVSNQVDPGVLLVVLENERSVGKDEEMEEIYPQWPLLTPMTSTSADVMMNARRFHSGGVEEAY
jgi:hypothetical protein